MVGMAVPFVSVPLLRRNEPDMAQDVPHEIELLINLMGSIPWRYESTTSVTDIHRTRASVAGIEFLALVTFPVQMECCMARVWAMASVSGTPTTSVAMG